MFGTTERYLSDQQIAEIETKTGGTAFNMPITLGSVAPTYNLPGTETGLVFTGEVLVDMYRGEITHWNDRRIAELNPDIDLPPLPVQVVHRSDGSGPTNVWTDYFSKVSDWWADNVGFGTSVDWPVGTGANGYPIASFAWVMVNERLDANPAIETREQAEELVEFLYWTITDGQGLSEPLDFAQLP